MSDGSGTLAGSGTQMSSYAEVTKGSDPFVTSGRVRDFHGALEDYLRALHERFGTST